MGATPDELKRDIDRTREELRADVDLLADKLAPRSVAQSGLEAAREKLGEPRVRAGLAAVLALLLLRRRRRSRRKSLAA